MDNKDNIILYSAQSKTVYDIIEKEGQCFSRKEYVLKKYGDSAAIFTAIYSFFVRELVKYIEKPEGAEYPYWAFTDIVNVDCSGGGVLLKLSVPKDETVLFDMYEWIKILKLNYLGDSEKEELEFRDEIKGYGIKNEADIMLSSFYPMQKRKIEKSWEKLFRYDKILKSDEAHNIGAVQAGLWRIKKEWILEVR